MRRLLLVLAAIMLLVPMCGCITQEGPSTTAALTTTAPPTTAPATTAPPNDEPPYTVRLTNIWNTDLGAEAVMPPVLVQDAACVITKERIMLVSGEGDVLWDAPLSGIMIMVPVVDGDALYLAYEDGRLERRDCTSGEVDWIRSVNIYSGFAPVCPYGGSLYVSTPQGYLMRLDAETGDIVWRIALPEGPAYSSIVPYEDTLLVDSFSYNVTVVEAETGAILDVWDTPFGMTDIFVHNDWVYAMSVYRITRLDARTGIAMWQYRFPGGGTWIRPLVEYPYALVTTVEDQLLCVSLESGTTLWSDEAMYYAGLALSGNVLVSGIAFVPVIPKVDPGMWDPNSVTPPGTPERELVAWDIETGARVLSMPADQGLKWPVAFGGRFVFATGTGLACYAMEYV